MLGSLSDWRKCFAGVLAAINDSPGEGISGGAEGQLGHMDLVQFNVSRVRGSFCQVGEEVKHTDIRIRFSALIRCRLFIGTFLSYELRICVHVLCTYVTKEP